jgi:hypothetical protein
MFVANGLDSGSLKTFDFSFSMVGAAVGNAIVLPVIFSKRLILIGQAERI